MHNVAVWSLSNLVALVRWNLLTYRDLWEWLDDPFHTPPLGNEYEQLLPPIDRIGQQNRLKTVISEVAMLD